MWAWNAPLLGVEYIQVAQEFRLHVYCMHTIFQLPTHNAIVPDLMATNGNSGAFYSQPHHAGIDYKIHAHVG